MMSKKSNLQEITNTHCLKSAMTLILILYLNTVCGKLFKTHFPSSFSKKQKQILIHGPTKSLLVTITIKIGMTRNGTY